MTRLADRMLERCQPFRLSLWDKEYAEHLLRTHVIEKYGKSLSTDQIERLIRTKSIVDSWEVASIEKFDRKSLDGVPIIAADDVALYWFSLPKGTAIEDVVSSMAPPFKKFFIEFQRVPNNLYKLYAWGALVKVREGMEVDEKHPGDEGKPRWVLEFYMFSEREKGNPFGPITLHSVSLAEDGTWFRHADGTVGITGGPFPFDKRELSYDEALWWGETIDQLLCPMLLTLSFFHCKNVEIRTSIPPEKLSRKYRKKHRFDLVRFHVLDIDPMKRVLERVRSGEKQDFRRALHICRGHFKTFTPDAPLFGRHTGTYWWPALVRGSSEEGEVIKDYRVAAPIEFGRAYREANENPPDPEREAPPTKDPDTLGRGLAAHNRTQNLIAEVVRKIGFVPRSPISLEPEFDLAWKADETTFVCEVKSLSSTNEERQLRMAIGQVIRYRQKMNAAGHEPVLSVIATERPPQDPSWIDLCSKENIVLVWPEIAETNLRDAAKVANTLPI